MRRPRAFRRFTGHMCSDTIQVFVNERSITVHKGETVLMAVRAADPQLADAIECGRGYVTDGVGRKIAETEPVDAGGIYRTVGATQSRSIS